MVAQVSRVYEVHAERHDRWWLLTVPEVPGAVSQVRNLAQAEEYAREAVAYVLGAEPDSFRLTVMPVLPEDLAGEVREARAAASELEALNTRVSRLSRKAAADLRSAGLTGADTAAVLGVSPQRVSQLLKAS